MTVPSRSPSAPGLQRRSFLELSIASAAAAALPGGAFAAGSDRLRIGLVGCGGRGVGAALQAVAADAGVVVTALGDVFADQLDAAAAALAASGRTASCELFHGERAAELVIGSDVDAVILATPPCFRPAEIAAAVQAGRHVYAEAPTGIDAAGVRRAAAAVEEGRGRGLSLAAGLPSRCHVPTRSMVAAIAAGACGRPIEALVIRETGLPWVRPVPTGCSPAEAAVRNWISAPRFSGGGFLAQLVPALDRCAWALGQPTPIAASALSRAVAWPQPATPAREAAARITFADGSTMEARIVRREGIEDRVEELVHGTLGTANLRHAAGAAAPSDDAAGNAACMASFIASLRSGPRRDDLATACQSTMLAVLAQTAVDTGIPARWHDLWRSSPAPRST